MSLSLIVAMTDQRVIGIQNRLPWHLPEDLKRFKALTMGHPILMGRKTFESIGKPLPGRQNVVITHNRSYQADGVLIVHSLDEALSQCDQTTGEEFVIGGAALFEAALPRVQKIYFTQIHHAIPGDVYFPAFDEKQFTFNQPIQHVSQGPEGLTYSYTEGIRRQ